MHRIETESPFGLPYQDRWTSEQVQECVELFDLTEEQTNQLLELKDRVSDLDDYWGNGPFELTRFVLEHTCHGCVATMEKRVRKCVEWRNEHQLDTLLETYSPPQTIYRFPGAILQGPDREGDFLAVLRQGDPLGYLQRYGRDELLQALYWGIEFTIRGPWQKELKRRPRRATAVIDLKGLCRRHYHPSLILLVQKLGFSLQLHYPYVVKKVLVVNAPAIFRFVWSLFKPFVFPHLRALMEVATEAQTEQLLKEYIDLKELPDCLAPGIGQGQPVRGLNPNWEIGLAPPPSPEDWDRPPLVYGPHSDASYYGKEQDTAATSVASSLSSFSEESNPKSVVRSSATLLLKGTWKQGIGSTSIHIAY